MLPQQISYHLAQECLKRAKAQNMAKRTADCMSIDFFCGAAALAQVTPGQEKLAQHLLTVTVLIICNQGLDGVRSMVRNYTGPGAETETDAA